MCSEEQSVATRARDVGDGRAARSCFSPLVIRTGRFLIPAQNHPGGGSDDQGHAEELGTFKGLPENQYIEDQGEHDLGQADDRDLGGFSMRERQCQDELADRRGQADADQFQD